MTDIKSDLHIPAGEYLGEVIDINNIDYGFAANELGISIDELTKIISGESKITNELADKIVNITTVPAYIWNELERK